MAPPRRPLKKNFPPGSPAEAGMKLAGRFSRRGNYVTTDVTWETDQYEEHEVTCREHVKGFMQSVATAGTYPSLGSIGGIRVVTLDVSKKKASVIFYSTAAFSLPWDD